MPSRHARILILCKTYPSPSGRHVETSCVAGMEENARLVRLFPVPFRLIEDERQFKKWQWITARVEKARNDRRPESHKLFVDTIAIQGDPLPTRGRWKARTDQLRKLTTFGDFAELDEARKAQGATLGLLRPPRVLGLDITPADRADWTEEEKQKLLQQQRQGGLFDDAEARRIATLRKVPFDFYYQYECGEEIRRQYRHKIVDWEASALYWTCRKRYGTNWEPAFRAKLEQQLPATDLIFLMGTIHRFPEQWLIVSLIYPPKPPGDSPNQKSLFDPSDG